MTGPERNQHLSSGISRRSLIQRITSAGGAAALSAAFGPGLIRQHVAADAQEASPPAEGRQGGSFTIGYAQGTSYAHFAHMLTEAGSENIYNRPLVQGKLLTRNYEHTEFKPDLAESWEFSDDGTTLTFHIRPGLTWHDGTPFSARDVDFTFHITGIPGLGSYNMGAAFNGMVVGNEEWIDGTADRIAGLSTPNDATVVFELIQAFSDDVLFGAFNTICIAPEHILNAYLDREKAPEVLQSEWATTSNTIGIGPFRVVEYVIDQHVVYEPFDAYYRGRPLLDQVIFRSFSDSQTLMAALESEEVDAGRLAAADLERFQRMEHLTVATPQAFSLSGSPFNTRQPYLNKEVRQGLVHAVDRQAIIDALYAGAVDMVHSPISMAEFGDSPNLVKFGYDPERAKALLEQGGWDPSRKIRWAVTELPSEESAQSYFAAINGYWEAVGVQAEFQVVGTETDQMGPPDYNFDLYQSSYPLGSPADVGGHYDPRLATYVSAGYDAEGFTDLWDKAKIRQSEEETRDTIWQLQEILAAECLGLWIARVPDFWAVNHRVHNLRPRYVNGRHIFDWEYETVWVED